MYFVLFVLDDVEKLEEVLRGWQQAGVGGATVLESAGLHRRMHHIPMRYLYGGDELEQNSNLTLFAVVESEQVALACLAAAEEMVGDLSGPNTGVFTAWPLLQGQPGGAIVRGVPKQKAQPGGE